MLLFRKYGMKKKGNHQNEETDSDYRLPRPWHQCICLSEMLRTERLVQTVLLLSSVLEKLFLSRLLLPTGSAGLLLHDPGVLSAAGPSDILLLNLTNEI